MGWRWRKPLNSPAFFVLARKCGQCVFPGMSRRTWYSISIPIALASLLCSLGSPTFAAVPDSMEVRGDSLFRAGKYQAALDAYTRVRWQDTSDSEILFKHFLACAFRGGDCRKEERLDFYYSEKTASPFTGVMEAYRRDRLEIFSTGPGEEWRAMRSGHWIPPAAFFRLTGYEDLANRARLREGVGLGLIALGTASALSGIGYWAVEGEDCTSPRDEAGCRELQTGSAVLGAAAVVLGYGGVRMRSSRVVPKGRAEEMAHGFNTRHLKRLIVDLPVFRRLETGLPAPDAP
jgi:hypothetical protein